jgi:general secretion pathway protein D
MELFPYTRRSTRWGICLILVLCLCGGASQAQEVNFDFEDADLRAVIQAVAEFTGRNFLVDPRVQGRVTVVAPTPLTEEQAYQVFQSVLEVNGFVTVEADGATKIVPAEEGKSRDTNVFEDDPQANLDDIQTRVLHLTYVNPERLVPILRPLVPAYGHMAADSESSSLIITDRAANVDRLVSIINRLDRPAKAGELEVIPLVHASAGEMSELLGRLYPTESGGLTVMDDIRTNSIIVKADVATRTEIRGLIQDLDLPTQSSGDTNVIFLNNADAENLAGVLQNMVESSAGQGEGALSSTDIMADPDTNAIIVRASQADFNTIRQVIENLDTSFDVGTNIRDVTLNPLATGSGLGVGFIDGTVILPDGTEVVNLVGLARALETDSDNNILSTPNILTMDNQEAEIIVGQNVPFVTGAFSQISSGSAVENPFQTIERRDVGLTLRIKPQITEGSAIKMEIYQEVSSVAQRGEATDIVTNTRSLQTTVVAENNRMLVLGGLIQDDISQNVQKVPLLGDIPILGNLFRYRNNTRNKTNLVVFLLPRIIRGYADMDEPTRRKYEYLEQMTEEQDVRNPESVPPPIQEWDFIVPGREPPETQLEETEAP